MLSLILVLVLVLPFLVLPPNGNLFHISFHRFAPMLYLNVIRLSSCQQIAILFATVLTQLETVKSRCFHIFSFLINQLFENCNYCQPHPHNWSRNHMTNLQDQSTDNQLTIILFFWIFILKFLTELFGLYGNESNFYRIQSYSGDIRL